ncbi:MAG: dethiobiotin synthase [Proteobacteria bacterium]|nr:dethiobiotin synthase [Pseudomonadota bacterium]
MKAFFVTGTDTGVGKTTVSTALLAAASQRGLRTACMKPVESGCKQTLDGRLLPVDATELAAVASMKQDLEAVCLYRFAAPVAPGVAAERAGRTIDFELVKRRFSTLIAMKPDFLLVEGAGGLLVPMGAGRMIADLIALLQIPMLVVARPGLGTINHTLLTIAVARQHRLDVAGLVFSCQEPDGEPLVTSNVREITRASQVRYLGCLPHLSARTLTALAEAAERSLECSFLMG